LEPFGRNGHRVVVTGLGVISPVGNTLDEFWKSLCEGKSGVGRITLFDASGFSSQIGGEVKGFDPLTFISPKDVKRMDRFTQFAVCAARIAVKDAGLDMSKEDPDRIGAIVGSGTGGLATIEEEHQVMLLKGPSRVSPFLIPMLIVNMAPAQIAITFGIKGPNSCAATACASGNHAIGDAYRIIQRGGADVMIAGGAEAAITPLGVAGFCAMRALSVRNGEPERASRPFDKDRDGFVIGEGAGIAVLESIEHARERGARIYAEMAGYGMSCDANHMTAPCPDGRGAALCMKSALADAGINPGEIDYINAHGTSTELNDRVETLAVKDVFKDDAKGVCISSTKSMTGHLLGASGGIEFAICAKVLETGIIPPTINLETPDPECDLDYVPNTARKKTVKVAMSNAFGFGGHNAALVVKKV
jgi:3-oxoacyl-[acyl-carrier-protein] synthase II